MTQLRNDLLAVDRDVAADLDAPTGLTLSQTVGIRMLDGIWWAFPCSWALSLGALATGGRRHHCMRALYNPDGLPLFPALMPPDSPDFDPYR